MATVRNAGSGRADVRKKSVFTDTHSAIRSKTGRIRSANDSVPDTPDARERREPPIGRPYPAIKRKNRCRGRISDKFAYLW